MHLTHLSNGASIVLSLFATGEPFDGKECSQNERRFIIFGVHIRCLEFNFSSEHDLFKRSATVTGKRGFEYKKC